MIAKQANKVTRIGVDEVKQQMPHIVFIDARSATSISRNPIQVPGAIHVPIKGLQQRLTSLPKKGSTLVTYCS